MMITLENDIEIIDVMDEFRQQANSNPQPYDYRWPYRPQGRRIFAEAGRPASLRGRFRPNQRQAYQEKNKSDQNGIHGIQRWHH